jgi:hypothetical protein
MIAGEMHGLLWRLLLPLPQAGMDDRMGGDRDPQLRELPGKFFPQFFGSGAIAAFVKE